jgi:flagellar biosynthesis regulator FlaF
MNVSILIFHNRALWVTRNNDLSSPNTEMVKRLRAAEEQLSTGPEASSSFMDLRETC